MSAHHRRRYPNLWERIRANVRFAPAPAHAGVHGPCWVWRRRLNARGYGFIGIWDRARGWSRSFLVHRVVLHLFHDLPWHEIPAGAHLCGIKACCSPFHLEAQSHAQNRAHYYEVERPARLALHSGREV
jgi:hypothetical protein